MSGESGRIGRLGRVSTRVLLRSYQDIRANLNDPGLQLDLEMLRHRDLDLSIKAGGLLAFDGLLLSAGLNPLSASPGAPLSLDALALPGPTWATVVGVFLLAAAAFFAVRCIMIGEDFDAGALSDDCEALARRMLASYCAALDAEIRLLSLATRLTYAGGAVTGAAFLWALATKWM